MALSKKHFKDLAVILGENRRRNAEIINGLLGKKPNLITISAYIKTSNDRLVNDVIRFCYTHNDNFKRGIFEDAVEEASKPRLNSDIIK